MTINQQPKGDREALKPCPFCGGVDAAFVEGADDDGQWVAVGCPECGVGTRQHYAVMDDAHPHAQNAWNTRTDASTVGVGAIPVGMVAWHGGDSAPEDWDGGVHGAVLLADGEVWGGWHGKEWATWDLERTNSRCIIAYTPRSATPSQPSEQQTGTVEGGGWNRTQYGHPISGLHVWCWHRLWERGVTLGYWYPEGNCWHLIDENGDWFGPGLEPTHWTRDWLKGVPTSPSQPSGADQGEVERLREALKPFVQHWNKWMDETDLSDDGTYNHPDDAPMSYFARVTYGDLRRARAALAPKAATAQPGEGE